MHWRCHCAHAGGCSTCWSTAGTLLPPCTGTAQPASHRSVLSPPPPPPPPHPHTHTPTHPPPQPPRVSQGCFNMTQVAAAHHLGFGSPTSIKAVGPITKLRHRVGPCCRSAVSGPLPGSLHAAPPQSCCVCLASPLRLDSLLALAELQRCYILDLPPALPPLLLSSSPISRGPLHSCPSVSSPRPPCCPRPAPLRVISTPVSLYAPLMSLMLPPPPLPLPADHEAAGHF